MEHSMIANEGSISRRTAIGGAFVGLATLAISGRAVGTEEKAVHRHALVLLLNGVYQPVVHAPNLGLHTVNLNDGSYQTTKIYPVSGIPGHRNLHKAVGDFYAQGPKGDLAAYHLPGGAFAMQFIPADANMQTVPDGQGGHFWEGTLELTILEATGIYRPFAGGHNHMVDKVHFPASSAPHEYCFCNISGP